MCLWVQLLWFRYKSRWQIVHFILGGTGVLSDWEYGNYDASDWPVLISVP